MIVDPLFPVLYYRRDPHVPPLFVEFLIRRAEQAETDRKSTVEARAIGRRLLASMPRMRLTVPGR